MTRIRHLRDNFLAFGPQRMKCRGKLKFQVLKASLYLIVVNLIPSVYSFRSTPCNWKSFILWVLIFPFHCIFIETNLSSCVLQNVRKIKTLFKPNIALKTTFETRELKPSNSVSVKPARWLLQVLHISGLKEYF